MDLSQIANAPRQIQIGEAFFHVSALTQYEWATFQGWVKDNVPRPEPPEGADAIDRMVYRNAWPPSIASKEWFVALDHPGCFARFAQVVIGKHAGRDVTDVEALALAIAVVDTGKVADLVMFALGGDPIDPKAATRIEVEEAAKLPEGDDPGDIFYQFAKCMNWSHDDIMKLTFPQIRYYRWAGKPPRAGTQRYGSVAAARAARGGAAEPDAGTDTGTDAGSPPVAHDGQPSGSDPPPEPPPKKYPDPEVQIFGDYRGPQ